MQCPNCRSENRPGGKFCENCGQPLPRACPNCGEPTTPNAKFCGNCGNPLAAPLTPAPSPNGRGENNLAVLQQAAPDSLREKIRAASRRMEGERKPVTIVFTDIVGSTALAEKLDPEEWKEIVQGTHRIVSAAVYHYEGIIAQLLGDGVLAFFGAPITHEDDPLRAVRAGLDIQRALHDYARDLEGYVDHLKMRVGINTGTVVVGAVGSDMHMEYLAIGDSVNVAARLQSAAQPGTVLISETTAKLVRASVELQDLGEIVVKGKSEPIKIFQVVEPKRLRDSGRGLEGLSSPLVGRDRELAQLRESLDTLREGHGQIVMILGEAGIGKTRLVEEGRKTGDGGRRQEDSSVVRPSSSVRWLEGRALSYGQALAFWTITQLIKNDLGLTDGDPEARLKVALRRRVNALFGPRASEVLPYLSHLLGVKLEGQAAERLQVLDGETLKRQVMHAIENYFARLAEAQPAVLVFEDLHWADPSTLAALDELLALTARVPLMLLLLARVERDHGAWQIKLKAETNYPHRYTEIQLKPLTNDEQTELVNNLLDIADLPATVQQLVLERAEGNPFYLEEIIRSLIEQGAILRDDGHWRAQSLISNLAIPDTLQGVLLARIDRLQDDVRRTLQLASVIGKSFLYRLLQAIAEAERELDEHLAQLQRADLVREKTRRPELEFIFKHSLTQEAAYDSLLLERRREFHRKVGAALEELFSERQVEFLGLLAYHFDRAGEKGRAIDYLIRAGDKTRMEDAHQEAIKFYQRAIDLLHEQSDSDRESKTWLKLGLIYHTNFDFAAAYRANEIAFAMRQAEKHQSAGANVLIEGRNTVCHSVAFPIATLDPGRMTDTLEGSIGDALFAGIAQLDAQLNLTPHAARSWEVLDGGTRYLIHLRHDVRWTDGSVVSADDYEWAWKRNLDPRTEATYAHWLDSVVGACAFRQAKIADSETVGVRALDALTLEIRLENPTAYFPYLFAMPVTFPLPRAVIERAGDEWWKPGQIVSNGAFRLVQFDQERGALERNADYFGEASGNLDRFEWRVISEASDRMSAYLEGEIDWLQIDPVHFPSALAPGINKREHQTFTVLDVCYLALLSQQPPLNDLRVRRALVQSLDKERIKAEDRLPATSARGGMIPPGIPGHSPGIGLPFDLETARRLLAEAGFPGGRGFPPITLRYTNTAGSEQVARAIVRQWQEHLGIKVQAALLEGHWSPEQSPEILYGPWTPDYPDPDGVMRTLPLYDVLKRAGWQNERFGELVAEAGRTADRPKRLAMYRDADRIWVAEESVVCALFYHWELGTFTKPWLKGVILSPRGLFSVKTITVEPH